MIIILIRFSSFCISAPVLTTGTDVTLTPGGQHTLQCQVNGGFEGRLLWLKDNRYIGVEGSYDISGDRIPDVRITPDSRTLTVLNAKAMDAGTYTCRFRYNYGRQWKSVAGTINVYGKKLVLMNSSGMVFEKRWHHRQF